MPVIDIRIRVVVIDGDHFVELVAFENEIQNRIGPFNNYELATRAAIDWVTDICDETGFKMTVEHQTFQ